MTRHPGSWALWMVVACLLSGHGCGGDVTGSEPTPDAAGGDTTAGDDGTSAGDANGSDGGAAVTKPWWTCPSDPAAAPQRTAGCEAPDDGSYGCKRPWGGLTVAGKTYTCNRCLGGDPNAQGAWRAIDFATEDPTVPLPGGRAELLIIDGNTWHLRARGKGNGATVEVHVDGWYACSDGAELNSQRLIFSTTAADPNDGLGWFAPDIFTGSFLTKGKNLMSWGIYGGFETDWIGDIIYCRVGSTVGGKPCTDPFLP